MRAVPDVALLVALACDRPACFVVRGGRYDAADLDTAAVVLFFLSALSFFVPFISLSSVWGGTFLFLAVAVSRRSPSVPTGRESFSNLDWPVAACARSVVVVVAADDR